MKIHESGCRCPILSRNVIQAQSYTPQQAFNWQREYCDHAVCQILLLNISFLGDKLFNGAARHPDVPGAKVWELPTRPQLATGQQPNQEPFIQ